MKLLHARAIAAMVCLSATLIVVSSSHAAPAPAASPNSLTSEDRRHLLNDKFQSFSSLSALPQSVKTAIDLDINGKHSASDPNPSFPMADVGAPYNSSDVVRYPIRPFRRLIFVAVSGDYCLISYERGGIGYSRNAALYHITGGKANLSWCGCISGGAQTLSDLRTAISAKNYRDSDHL